VVPVVWTGGSSSSPRRRDDFAQKKRVLVVIGVVDGVIDPFVGAVIGFRHPHRTGRKAY